MNKNSKIISIVIPCYNEEGNIEILYNEIFFTKIYVFS
jgi:glycosyltransferase involved in cell wall biosynthesis